MSDLKLFRLTKNAVEELDRKSVDLEKSLQTLIEQNLEALLGVRFVASEYDTGKKHGGRVDTLGLDENGCPVIIEYKRAVNQNVINQGLFYLDWLLDHKAEFKLMVMKLHGKADSERIEWGSPRLLCIAGDFTKYDEHAVKQMNRNIDLVRYQKYGKDLLLLDLVTAQSGPPDGGNDRGKKHWKTFSEYLAQSSKELKDRFETLKSMAEAMGDDVQVKTLKYHAAFRRIKNFACIHVNSNVGLIKLRLKVDPNSVRLEKGFSRDVTKIGPIGMGNLEVTIRNDEDLKRVQPLMLKSYEAN